MAVQKFSGGNKSVAGLKKRRECSRKRPSKESVVRPEGGPSQGLGRRDATVKLRKRLSPSTGTCEEGKKVWGRSRCDSMLGNVRTANSKCFSKSCVARLHPGRIAGPVP